MKRILCKLLHRKYWHQSHLFQGEGMLLHCWKCDIYHWKKFNTTTKI